MNCIDGIGEGLAWRGFVTVMRSYDMQRRGMAMHRYGCARYGNGIAK